MSNRNLVLIITILIGLIGGVFYYVRKDDAPRYDWNDSSWSKKAYSEQSDEPYGILIVHRLLESYFPGHTLTDLTSVVGDELPQDSSKHYNYVFVGEAMYMDSLSTRRLLDFVSHGNTALISSKTIPFDLMNYIYYQECEDVPWNDYESIQDSVAHATLEKPRLDSATTFQYVYQNVRHNYRWHYIGSDLFCSELPQKPLGYLNDSLINFASFPYGKGKFLLHTNPIAFTNYSLLRPETHRYAESILSWLDEGNIYWDVVSRVPEQIGRRRNNGYADNAESSNTNPLTFMLGQPGLAWAWYLLVSMALIWVIFRAKRRQRIIPILPKNENSSYQFISTIANLHFREKNYQGLCIQQMRLFLAHIRERYNLVAPISQATDLPRTDDLFFSRLAAVSEVPEAFIRDIFKQYRNTVQYQPTEQMLVDLHLTMEAFFKKAK